MKVGDLYVSHLPRCKCILGSGRTFADEAFHAVSDAVRINHGDFCTVLQVKIYRWLHGPLPVPYKHVQMLTPRGPAWVNSEWFCLDHEEDGMHPVV